MQWLLRAKKGKVLTIHSFSLLCVCGLTHKWGWPVRASCRNLFPAFAAYCPFLLLDALHQWQYCSVSISLPMAILMFLNAQRPWLLLYAQRRQLQLPSAAYCPHSYCWTQCISGNIAYGYFSDLILPIIILIRLVTLWQTMLVAIVSWILSNFY